MLEGKRVVSVDSNSVRFYDATTGSSLTKYDMSPQWLSGSICVDRLAENSFFVMIDRNIERFEYVNGEWKQEIIFEQPGSLVDFIDMDRLSGLIYFIINPAFGKFKAFVIDRDGKLILKKKLPHGSSGLCLDRFTGRLFVAHDTFIYVYE
ncbi:predicted protein [Naegleria gruberi]|uniref:Predicted protein n=1 Tax=Naegleria gruberi TaxID=5762 RepID=D2VHQ2_NAEGR|nr:uncharacterized protein NAEGRDRAFT_68406 [Naegleria gruberi]EFC43714.1 predicted protein [Naegleria gruberi]|eukprot:XP_002676458.1 predicted protein [Naegleria gruberi strain NEG-M]